MQVAFCRFFFSAVTAVPFMLPRGLFYFKTPYWKWHLQRGALGVVAIVAVTFSVARVPLAQNTCLLFTEALFFLPLGALLLKEKIGRMRWVCSIFGFAGIVLATYQDFGRTNWWIFAPLISALFFALSNVLIKRMVWTEHILTSLFYFGVVTSVLFFVPALHVWQPLTWKQIGLLAMIGINGNLLQVFAFKSFALAEVSALMPLRYTEWVFSAIFGFVFFRQMPTLCVVLGGLMIVGSTCAITLFENRRKRVRV